MTPILRICPRCDYPIGESRDRCPECGVATPLDLRVLQGGISPGHLRKKDLLINVALRLVVGMFVLMITLAIGSYAIYLLRASLAGSSSAPKLTIPGVAIGTALVAALGGATVMLLYKVPGRFRAIFDSSPISHTAQWAWNELELWTDTSAYPQHGQSWKALDSVTVKAKRGSVEVRLFGPSVLHMIAFLGSDADAAAIKTEIDRLIAEAKRRPARGA